MIWMNTTPNYRRPDGAAAQAAPPTRGVIGEVVARSTAVFGFFPGTPPYRAAPVAPAAQQALCCEPEVHVVEVVGLDGGVGSAEGPAPEEAPPTCMRPVTIVIKRKAQE